MKRTFYKTESHLLNFRWTTSRGRATYGYNICSLYVDGDKVAACNGGGYDMKGTCLAAFMCAAFHEELLALRQPFYGLTFHDPNFNPATTVIEGQTVAEREKEGKSLGLERYQAYYAASSELPTERHTQPDFNGACGMSSVEKVLKAIGWSLRFSDDRRNEQSFILEPVTQEAPCPA